MSRRRVEGAREVADINTSERAPRRPQEQLKPHSPLVVFVLKVSAFSLIILYFLVPLVVKLCPAVMSEIIFLHRVHWPPYINFDKPEEFGLTSARNFNIKSLDGVKISAWHILPNSIQAPSNPPESFYLNQLGAGLPVILYLHGNAGTRAGAHRVQLYKVLARSGYHIITIDYRGFGDSEGYPTEEGVAYDAAAFYKWIKHYSKDSPVFVWGHSLGSAIATKVSKQLCDQNLAPDGIILEAPFNNIVDATMNHPLTLPFLVMPWFTWVFVEGIISPPNNITFTSDDYIGKITSPVLILHAKDDNIIPYDLGVKLYDAATSTKRTGSVKMVTFDGNHEYRHKHIHKAPELPAIIKEFVQGAQ